MSRRGSPAPISTWSDEVSRRAVASEGRGESSTLDAMSKTSWPAPERNKGPILEVLRRVLPRSGTVLETSGYRVLPSSGVTEAVAVAAMFATS